MAFEYPSLDAARGKLRESWITVLSPLFSRNITVFANLSLKVVHVNRLKILTYWHYILNSPRTRSEVLFRNTLLIPGTDEVTKSGSLLPLGKNSLLSKIGDQRRDPNCTCKV